MTGQPKRMGDLDLSGKRVLIREDLNVPVKNGKVSSDARILAALPTIRQACAANARVVVMSHLGRPKEGVFDAEFSLAPVAARLSELLGVDVPLLGSLREFDRIQPGSVGLLENVRFLVGEDKNAVALAQEMAAACDIYVMDAFATAHRAQCSTHGVAKFARVACAGPLLAAELDALGKALKAPARPMVALVGGSKVSTKLEVLESLATIADSIIVGGGIANTFIAAAGYNVGKSLYEAELVEMARTIAARVNVPLPEDVVVAREVAPDAVAEVKALKDVSAEDRILDIGPRTARAWAAALGDAKTILWNGPVGVFELDQFGEGTRVLAEAIAASPAFSIAGGGDTLAAIDKYAVTDGISYISTGGGAFLEFVEGKTLPAVQILETRANT